MKHITCKCGHTVARDDTTRVIVCGNCWEDIAPLVNPDWKSKCVVCKTPIPTGATYCGPCWI